MYRVNPLLHMRAHRGLSGFSLIEVLVTTLIFSIGVLGVSGLNIFSKRSAFDAVQRSYASELAYTILEEMRTNKGGLGSYLATGTFGRGSLGAEPAPDCDAVGADCTAAEFANHGMWSWERLLDSGLESAGGEDTGGLVSPTACITGPAGAAAGVYTVTIVWRGVTETTDPDLNACGAATGLYGDSNSRRRMVVVQSFIDPTV
jgi:type IV pilus assembly protein PilV